MIVINENFIFNLNHVKIIDLAKYDLNDDSEDAEHRVIAKYDCTEIDRVIFEGTEDECLEVIQMIAREMNAVPLSEAKARNERYAGIVEDLKKGPTGPVTMKSERDEAIGKLFDLIRQR